jgi:thiol:disulfide interchange protein DsbD
MKDYYYLLLLAFNGNAQILRSCKMDYQNREKSETNYILTFNAVIENDWHLSQFTDGPLPLEIIFKIKRIST